MRGMLAARAWGVSVGLACMAMAACARAPDTAPTDPVTTGISSSSDLRLTHLQLVKALEIRARVARMGMAPRETLRREYDRLGHVVAEYVKSGKNWVRRESTLPASVSTRTLSSFLVPAGAALTSGSFVSGYTESETVDATTYSVTDSVLTDSTSAAQSHWGSTATDDYSQSGGVYYSNASGIGVADSSTAGVVFILVPGTADAYIEYDISGGDWTGSISDFHSETGYLRAQHAGWSANPVHGQMGIPIQLVASVMRTQDPCYDDESRLIKSLVVSAVSFALSWFIPGSGIFLWRIGATAAITSVGLFAALQYCKSQNSWYYGEVSSTPQSIFA